MAFDATSAWIELGAFVASKPNHGRHELLGVMARIAAEHSIPEEEFKRALRLSLPAFADLLFDRVARDEALRDPGGDVPVADEPLTGAAIPRHAVRPTMAA